VVCEMNPELFALLGDPDFRLKARMILVARYYTPKEKVALFETLGLQMSGASEAPADRVLEEAVEAAKRKGRCARFAVRVVGEYRFTCALTVPRVHAHSRRDFLPVGNAGLFGLLRGALGEDEHPDNQFSESNTASGGGDACHWAVSSEKPAVTAPL